MAVFKHLTTAQARKQALAECQLFEFLLWVLLSYQTELSSRREGCIICLQLCLGRFPDLHARCERISNSNGEGKTFSGSASIVSGGGAVAGLVGRFAGAAASAGPIATFALPATGAGAAGVDSEQGLQSSQHSQPPMRR